MKSMWFIKERKMEFQFKNKIEIANAWDIVYLFYYHHHNVGDDNGNAFLPPVLCNAFSSKIKPIQMKTRFSLFNRNDKTQMYIFFIIIRMPVNKE